MGRLLMARLLLLTAVFSLGSLSAVMAQTAAERATCQADVKKLCPGLASGGGRILNCLANHKSQVSEACMKVLKAHGK
jgi:hypothetical protein